MKIATLAILVLVAVLSDSTEITEEELQEWETFKVTYSKTYSSKAEEEKRKHIFINNLVIIKEHNQKYDRGETTFTLGTNEYADLTSKEFNTKLNGLLPGKSLSSGKRYTKPNNLKVPSYKDWRWSGCVTGVKNQKHCGSCWAFSSTGALEAANCFNTSKLVSLSEQNLVDCTISYGNGACTGGWMYNAFQYVIDNNGIDKEKDYKYTHTVAVIIHSKDGRDKPYRKFSKYFRMARLTDYVCKYKEKYKGGTATSYTYVPWGDDESLMAAVGTVAPISVGVDASLSTFHLYRTGVYYDSSCSYKAINHAVLLVGYGETLFRKRPYWTIKNSWGWTWGEFGYIRIARNQTNMCGISSEAYYPSV